MPSAEIPLAENSSKLKANFGNFPQRALISRGINHRKMFYMNKQFSLEYLSAERIVWQSKVIDNGYGSINPIKYHLQNIIEFEFIFII